MGPSTGLYRNMTTRREAWHRRVGAVMCVVVGWCTPAIACESIAAAQAACRAGKTSIVCGVVASTARCEGPLRA